MFHKLTDKLQNVFSGLSRQKKLTEDNIVDVVREVRLALLEADVNYSVASQLVKRVKEKALGDDVIKSVTPSQQFIKIIHEELVELMGSDEAELNLQAKPSVIMLCGLQGSGKTTHAAKLAHYLSIGDRKKKVLLAACDLQRPAAIEQLHRLGESVSVPVFSIEKEKNPVKVATKALDTARDETFDVLIVDTAGRLHIDEPLMVELEAMKNALQPQEVLYVANATTGQDAVKTAAEFDQRVSITGTILSMLDSNARAGAAISIREITKKPLKFEGIGEKPKDLQVFNPTSMADRVLGMGDVVNLVKKAEENLDEEETRRMEKKLKKSTFNYEDFLSQMKMFERMGSFSSLLQMLPGMSNMGGVDLSTDRMKNFKTIILSMTVEERQEKVEITPSRKKRIAKGSSCPIEEVNKMISGFKKIRKMFKKLPKKKGLMGKLPNMNEMKNLMEGKKWH